MTILYGLLILIGVGILVMAISGIALATMDARADRHYKKRRQNALYRASNGESLPRIEREDLHLPDWTA